MHPDTKRARTIVDTIADNAADAGVILGGEKVKPADVDMRWIGAIFSCNGVVEETGLAAGVLGHPANGIAWVARRIAPYGLAIEPGQIILAGSFTRASADPSWRSSSSPTTARSARSPAASSEHRQRIPKC